LGALRPAMTSSAGIFCNVADSATLTPQLATVRILVRNYRKANLMGRKRLLEANMSDTSHVLEAMHMSEDKGFFERLLDFSFQYFITQKYAKLLYGIHLLLGLIVGTWYVFNGFQASTSQGLLTLLIAVVGYFLWILYVRVALEFLVAMFRTAENIARASGR
jgi:hypothetical protein